MNFKLSRKEKIKLLQKIKEGKISLQSLQPPKTYIFIQRTDMPGTYEMNGKLYTENEYLEFCNTVSKNNKNSIIWNEEKTYDDLIITMYTDPGAPVNEGMLNFARSLTLNI